MRFSSYDAIPPEYANKQQGGLVTSYCRSLAVRNLIRSLKVEETSILGFRVMAERTESVDRYKHRV